MARLLLLFLFLAPLFGQQVDLDSYLQLLKLAPGASTADKVKSLNELGITLSERGLDELSKVAKTSAAAQPYSTPALTPAPTRAYPMFGPPQLRSPEGKNKFLGTVNSNQFDPDSIANPYGQYGSPYSPNSVNNPFGQYGSPYSPNSIRNPFTVGQPTPSLPALPTVPTLPTLPRLPALPRMPVQPSPPQN